jgi:23S rRNA (uracil1939-C5)-methyltransferase
MPIKPYTLTGLQIEDAVNNGMGLARHEGRVVFVEGAVPGDVVRAEVYVKKRRYYGARLLALEQPSPHRVEAKCQHFGSCGGCKWQHLAYEAQLFYKHKQVVDALTRIGHLTIPDAEPALGCLQPFQYRNKLEFSFSSRRWLTREEIASGQDINGGALGFHPPGSFEKVVDVETCLLMPPLADAIRNRVRQLAQAHQMPYYDIKQQAGYLRTLLIRRGENTGEWLVGLVTSQDRPDWLALLRDTLLTEFPDITSLVHIYNTKANDSYTDLPATALHGNPWLHERLGRYTFQISPVSFFQTNTRQAERLYQTVYDAIGPRVGTLYDLYCGAGSIGIYCEDRAERIAGVEYVPQAVADADVNCRLNQLTHLRHEAGDIARLLNPDFVARHGSPDVVVADPPRVGMEGNVAQQILALDAPKVIYVSCNPATQARDLQVLAQGYEITRVQPLDMFPHTNHVETVVTLVRR